MYPYVFIGLFVYNYTSHIDVHTFHLASVISISMPCLSVCRNMEDFVTWTDTSKIRKHVLEYNEEVYTVSLLHQCKVSVTQY